jgi:diguanylate cyclase (GGDEF)-like protein
VLFLDLDRFKRVNDSLGIGEGDRLLEAVGRRLREAARAWDLANGDTSAGPSMVARLGGDEFTILMPRLRDPADAARLSRRVIDAVRRPFEISGHQVFLGLSVGAAVFPRDGSDPETLLRHADLAMAAAKKAGGNACEFFESAMNQSAFERLVLENELREAVREDQLVVFYQPKIGMTDGSLAGVEALVRWQHPTAGLLSPGAFIEAAEECGLIGEIGDWVLRRACQEASDLMAKGHTVPVAVNVSAMQFESETFSDTVLEALQDSGLPPEMLELELTESTAMRDPERVIQQIEPLREMGVTFAIDDFGTGHSSLSYLTRMPFDVFKIDQTFVREMSNDDHARVVVETILALAKSLKLKTVAEGVETAEQYAQLRSLGATLAQGYLFSRPIPLDELERFARPEAGVGTG